MTNTFTKISTAAAATLAMTLVAGAALAAKIPGDPCKFQKTLKQSGTEISIDIPAGEPCGLGTFFMTIVPRKGDPQTLKADRDGMLVDAMLSELSGGAPAEIVVIARGDGEAGYGAISIFESVMGVWTEKRVSRLSGAAAEGYAGYDTFAVKDGVITREFPLYLPAEDPAGSPRPSGEKKTLKYDFAENRWVAP